MTLLRLSDVDDVTGCYKVIVTLKVKNTLLKSDILYQRVTALDITSVINSQSAGPRSAIGRAPDS